MKKIHEIYEFINVIAPFNTALKFDNSGLLVGNLENTVTKILLALDITNEVVREAKSLGAELIISHHPVIFKPMKSLDFNSPLHLLSKYEINAICAHTNLDVASHGVNFHLARKLSLSNLKPLTYEENQPLGIVGIAPRKISCNELAILVKNQLNCKGLRYTQTTRKIEKIAVCSGSGGEFVSCAALSGADAFITGEIKHNQILQANNLDLMIIDAGHYKTENVIIEPLKKELENQFNNIGVFISTAFTDGIEYI